MEIASLDYVLLAMTAESGWVDPGFRVFVVGRDIFKARKLLGEELPVKD